MEESPGKRNSLEKKTFSPEFPPWEETPPIPIVTGGIDLPVENKPSPPFMSPFSVVVMAPVVGDFF